MSTPPTARCPSGRAPVLAAGALALFAGPSLAQLVVTTNQNPGTTPGSGSESFYSTARNALATGGTWEQAFDLVDAQTQETVAYDVEFGLGYALGLPSAADDPVVTGSNAPAFDVRFQAGAVFTPAVLETPLPVVFGMSPATADADGGETRTLFGANLTAPGAGVPTVRIGGVDALGVQVVSDHELAVTTPPGRFAGTGNAKGEVVVELQNALSPVGPGQGGPTLVRELTYLPAIARDLPAQVGGTADLRFLAEPGSFAFLFVVLPLPAGLSFPLPPLQGSLRFSEILFTVASLDPVPTGRNRYPVPIPDSPSLAGATVSLQGAAITSLFPVLAGDLTTLYSLPIRP